MANQQNIEHIIQELLDCNDPNLSPSDKRKGLLKIIASLVEECAQLEEDVNETGYLHELQEQIQTKPHEYAFAFEDNHIDIEANKELISKKAEMLFKLGELRDFGMNLSQNYSLDSDLAEMEHEYRVLDKIKKIMKMGVRSTEEKLIDQQIGDAADNVRRLKSLCASKEEVIGAVNELRALKKKKEDMLDTRSVRIEDNIDARLVRIEDNIDQWIDDASDNIRELKRIKAPRADVQDAIDVLVRLKGMKAHIGVNDFSERFVVKNEEVVM